jgi:hypothetical protein
MIQLINSGAGIRLIINGNTVGFATGISFSRSTATKYIYEIDNPIPVEIAPTTYAVQGSLSGFRLRDSGSLDGQGIMDITTVSAFFDFKYATIEIVDIGTNKTVYKINKVVFDNDSWNIQTKALVTFNVSFKGIFVQST